MVDVRGVVHGGLGGGASKSKSVWVTWKVSGEANAWKLRECLAVVEDVVLEENLGGINTNNIRVLKVLVGKQRYWRGLKDS